MSQPNKVTHPTAGSFYAYNLGYRFDPGAQGDAFVPLFNLPMIVYRGAARLAGSLRVFQHPQVYFNQQAGVVGLGGLQAGQVILQPLLDPSQFEGA